MNARRILATASVAVALFALLPHWAFAALPPLSPTVEATGRATIYHGDVAGARDRALADALEKGLERYAGLRLEASTWIRDGELLEREIRARARGWVRTWRVLDERRAGEELVLSVRMEVSAVPVEDAFRRFASATTTVLLTRERNLDRPVRGRVLAAVLADPFFGSRLAAPPPEELAAFAERAPADLWTAPSRADVREIGLRWLAGYVVVADAGTWLLPSGAGDLGYHVSAGQTRPIVAATGNVAVYAADTGELLLTRRFDDLRGSDATSAERAGLEALSRLAVEMRRFLVSRLSQHLRQVGFPLRVVVRGEAARDGAAGVARVLEGVRWVERVELSKEGDGAVALLARCRENPGRVVEELRAAPEVEVVRFDAVTGVVEVR